MDVEREKEERIRKRRKWIMWGLNLRQQRLQRGQPDCLDVSHSDRSTGSKRIGFVVSFNLSLRLGLTWSTGDRKREKYGKEARERDR